MTAPAELLILLALCGYLAFRAEAGFRPAPANRIFRHIAGWSLLLGCALLLIFPRFGTPEIDRGVAFFCGLTALLVFFEGVPGVRAASVPLLGTIVIPFRESLWLAVSYPLRAMATTLGVVFLKCFGFSVQYEQTTIRFNGLLIAITDYCGGITLLEAMLLLGGVIACRAQRTAGLRFLHFLCLVPSIIFANAIRLATMISISAVAGPRVFYGVWHDFFGYAQVAVCILLFTLFGNLIAWCTSEKP